MKVFAHMLTSQNSQITGDFFNSPVTKEAQDVFYNIAFKKNQYNIDGWVSGRITSDDNFTNYEVPKLPTTVEDYKGDFIAPKSGDKYYVSIDTSGKLAWKSNTFNYRDTKAEVLQVLTNKASDAYKQYLRDNGVSYIICGDDKLDIKLLMDKLENDFGFKCLMLGGGATLNWSFIKKGYCDEVSTVIAPVANGNTNATNLYVDNSEETHNVDLSLKSVQVFGDTVWIVHQSNS